VKTKMMTGLRTTAAASGVALLMLVAACGDAEESRDDQQASQESADEQPADDTAAADEAADEGSEEGADTGEDTAADEGSEDDADGAEDSADDDAGESEGGAAAGVVAPGEEFDPCTAISADDINGVLGSDFDEGTSNDMSSIAMCVFGDMDSGQSVIVQWAPTPGSLDDALTAMDSLYGDLDEPEPVTVTGADEAAVITGTISEVDATVLIATADGGFLQVVSTAQDMSSDQAVQIAETTFAGV